MMFYRLCIGAIAAAVISTSQPVPPSAAMVFRGPSAATPNATLTESCQTADSNDTVEAF
jgi:hypothetical protein